MKNRTGELKQIKEQCSIMILVYTTLIILHMLFADGHFLDLFIASLCSFILVFLAILLKIFIKKPNLPGFAWGTLISFLATLPISPVQELILTALKPYSFSLVALPLLAYAGISVGLDLDKLKKLSWKLVIISLLVMASTYFGSALIAQIVMKLKGVI